MKVKEFYDDIAKQADTTGLHVNAADTSRVLHLAFLALSYLEPEECLDLLAKAIVAARKKNKRV